MLNNSLFLWVIFSIGSENVFVKLLTTLLCVVILTVARSNIITCVKP